MKGLLAVIGVGMAGMTVYNFASPNAVGFSMSRIIFWHLPCALLCTWYLFLTAYLGWKYLSTRDLKWDVRLGTGVEIGSLLALLTMITGIMFSQQEWGKWWQWDPRQTSFLMVLFLFALALVMRGAFGDEKKRAAVSSSYAVLTLLPSIFLIFVFPRLPSVFSNHPSDTIPQGKLDLWYRIGVYGTLTFLALASWVIYKMRVRLGLLQLKLDEANGNRETLASGSAATGVVRPVAVHEEH